MTFDPVTPEWLAVALADPVALLARLSEHAARFQPPLLTKRLVDAMLRYEHTANAGLNPAERLRRVYAGDAEVADYFAHFMERFGVALDAVRSVIPLVLEPGDHPRDRTLSALLLACEATLTTANVDCADHVARVARGELSLDDALRAVELAKGVRARAIAHAAVPAEPPGTWVVEDPVRTLAMPVWSRLERNGDDIEDMSELERRLYRRSVESKYRMPIADRALVVDFYRQWGEHEGWPVTSGKELGLDVVEIRPDRPLAEHGFAFTIWVADDWATLAMHWKAPHEVEKKIAELAEIKRKLGI